MVGISKADRNWSTICTRAYQNRNALAEMQRRLPQVGWYRSILESATGMSFGAWLGGLPWWATTGEVLDWCREHYVEPTWLQWLPSKMEPDATLYSCVVIFEPEELRNAALQSLPHSFYGWRVTRKEQRPPPKAAGPKTAGPKM